MKTVNSDLLIQNTTKAEERILKNKDLTGNEKKLFSVYTSLHGNQIDAELKENLHLAYREFKPICVSADGLNVMDDVGSCFSMWLPVFFVESFRGRL